MAVTMFNTHDDLLEAVKQTDKPFRVLGNAPGGHPLIAVEAGGDKNPSIMITAGAHATEQAGVSAAVELIETLETEHRVYIVPSRDPIGLNGYEYALELALGETINLSSYDTLAQFLKDEAELIYQEEDLILSLIGDTGFATKKPVSDGSRTILSRLKELSESKPEILEPFKGRRIYSPPGHIDIQGAKGLNRAYTLVISPDGTPMHLNRFFSDKWAPVETRCVTQLLKETQPKLFFDNHETADQGNRYHISLRPQGTEKGNQREKHIALTITRAIVESGIELATDEERLNGPTKFVGHDVENQPDESFYSRAGPGAYWVDPNITSPPRLGEGLNATDYAAEHYGLAFTVETGMHGTFEERKESAILSVQTGVQEFENQYI